LARSVPFFLVGIWSGTVKAYDPVFAVLLLFGSLFWLSLRIFRIRKWLSYTERWKVGTALYIGLFAAGFETGYLQDERLSESHITHRKATALIGELVSEPVKKGSRFRAVMKSEAALTQGKWTAVSGKVLVYFPGEFPLTGYSIGSRVLICSSCQAAEPPALPGQFDFREWLARKQVYDICRPSHSQFCLLPSERGFSLEGFMADLQKRLIGIFREAGFSGNELGVVSALVLGDDDGVDNSLLHAFSASGTLHVLSVSGMHVAVIHLAVERLLSVFYRRRKVHWSRTTISMIFLWSYALLTGFSPAVRRAASMLSLVLIGKTLNRPADIWNLLAASVLILVAFRPGLLFESGFQLSYAAVAGILGFYPWLSERTGEGGRLTGFVIKSVCVALSAQWFTFPLGLYYFHQFPNYFLPANLVIIPWSTAVMFGGILLLFLHPFPVLFAAAASILHWLTAGLNRTVLLFDRLPGAQTAGIWMSGAECVLLLGAVIFITLFLTSRRNLRLFSSLALLFCFFGVRIWNTCSVRERTTVFSWNSGRLPVTLVCGLRSLTIGKNNEADSLRITNGLDAMGVTRRERYSVDSCPPVLALRMGFPALVIGNRILFPDTTFRFTSERPPHRTIRDR
jgi:competence protein ComEC